MPYVRSFLFRTVSLAALATGMLFPVSSQAGFDFKPSPVVAAPAESTIPVVPAMPPESVEATDLSPQAPLSPPDEIKVVDPIASVTVPSETISEVAEIPQQHDPVVAPPATVSPAAENLAPAIPEASVLPDAIGFGNAIPLVLALREIVPPQYAYSFDPSVNQGALVTWNGGRPWDVALSDALKPLKFGIRISGMTVRVLPIDQMASGGGDDVSHSADMPQEKTVEKIVAEKHEEAMMPSSGNISTVPAKGVVREVYIRRNETEPRVVEREIVESSVVDKGVAGMKENAPHPADATMPEGIVAEAHDESTSFGNDVSPAPAKGAVREVYIRRNETEQEEGETPSFWSRLKGDVFGNSEDSAESAAIAPSSAPAVVPLPAPPVEQIAAPEGVQPVSLTQANMDPSAPVESSKKAIFDPYAVQSWEAQKGESLKKILNEWSDDAGVQVQWNVTGDYTLPEAVRLEGSYTEAITRVLTSYGAAGDRPSGQLRPNLPDGPSVLIIESSGG